MDMEEGTANSGTADNGKDLSPGSAAGSGAGKVQRRVSVTSYASGQPDIQTIEYEPELQAGKLRRRKSRPRTAMGVTIEPISVLAQPTPGPQYDVKDAVTRPKSAAYSIKAPYKFQANRHPGPDTYDTSGDLLFMKRSERPKSVVFKSKGITAPYHAVHSNHVRPGPGAGHYRPRNTDTGRQAERFSFGIRHKAGIHAGRPNTQIPPTDTHGFDTPGPNYWPEEDGGKEYTFGTASVHYDDTPGPGPMQEDFGEGKTLPTGRACVIAEKLDKFPAKITPGPSDYQLPDTMGAGQAKTISCVYKVPTGFVGPSPCAYTPQRLQYAPSISMTYRETIETEAEPTPAPCDYDKSALNPYPEAPGYIAGERCRPVYPDILQYPYIAKIATYPSPNKHGSIRDFSVNDRPSYSMKWRQRQRRSTVPGPNAYAYEHTTPVPPHRTKAAAYTIGTTLPAPCNRRGFAARGTNEEGPGPGEYRVNDGSCRPEPVAKSFGMKHKHLADGPGKVAPGPKYSINTGTTCKGSSTGRSASFKGRQSNYVFQARPVRAASALL